MLHILEKYEKDVILVKNKSNHFKGEYNRYDKFFNFFLICYIIGIDI